MHLTIYTKPGCHLCDQMKGVVRHVAAGNPGISVEVIDISNDPQLNHQYGLEIPVLMIDGRKAAKYRISEGELARILGVKGKG